MTTTELATKNYERLDGYIDKIVGELQTAAELMKEYFNAAKEEGISDDEAKKYLRSRIPNSTYYKYLPAEIERKQTRPKKDSTVESNLIEESSRFNTEGMGVVDEEPEEVTQSVSCPPTTTSTDTSIDEQNDSIARIQELEKMVSDLSFQKGSDTSPITPPAQQIIIVPHQMILEIDKKRMSVGLNGIYKLQTENNIVTGIEVVNVQ